MLSFCLFACFSSDGQGWVRRWSCLLMVRFVFLFCLLFRWGVLHRVLLVIGWCQVWYYSGFLCVSSHYLILPRVSSLVVQGLGVSAPTPKLRAWSLTRNEDSTSGLLWHYQPRLDAWVKCSDLVHWEDPERSGGEGGGRGDQDGKYMYIHGWFMPMYDKNHYNIVK